MPSPRRLLTGLALASALISPPLLAESRPLAVVAPWEINGSDPATSGYIFARMGIAETLVEVDAEGRQAPG
ncbi:ABC transporter substrate-binding protein, partial [Halomonas sp. 328]|nr:ABC transporter substrate-binding protein [Halomonas sp. 328]